MFITLTEKDVIVDHIFKLLVQKPKLKLSCGAGSDVVSASDALKCSLLHD
jgi:hypothetical protein